MRKRVIFLLVLGICLFVSGCTSKEEKERQDNKQQSRITKEEFLEYYGIPEEEVEGIDVTTFVRMCDIKLDDTDVADIRLQLDFYKEDFGDMGLMDYGYMLEESVNTPLTQDNVNDIVRLVWQINEGDGVEALAFDFKNEKIYEGYRIEEFDNSYLVGIPDDAIKESVIQLINEYDLYSWKDYYKGGSTEGTTASYNWQMAIEFSDGTIYRTGGDGLGDKARPDNMEDFIADLRKCIP